MTIKNWITKQKDTRKFTKVGPEGDADKNKETTRSDRYFTPDVDIIENEKELVLYADMPGVNRQDVSVSVDNGVLTIEGLISLSAFEGRKPIYSEYRIGNYFRRFQLGETIDTEKISAEMKSGVLKLILPKAEKKSAKTIEIQ